MCKTWITSFGWRQGRFHSQCGILDSPGGMCIQDGKAFQAQSLAREPDRSRRTRGMQGHGRQGEGLRGLKGT